MPEQTTAKGMRRPGLTAAAAVALIAGSAVSMGAPAQTPAATQGRAPVRSGGPAPAAAPDPSTDPSTVRAVDPALDSLTIGTDRRVMLNFGGGERLTFRMESTGPSVPVINPETASRLGLQGTGGIARLRVGPVRIRGLVGRVNFNIGGVAAERRAIWYDRPVTAAPTAGEIGPYALPQARIIFILRDPFPDEQLYSLPMSDEGLQGPMTRTRINGERTEVRFDLSRPETVVTASAASALAMEFGGVLTGPVWRMPIYLGIDRPVRRVDLSQPFILGPIRIDHFAARLTDYGNTTDIPVSDTDPGETLVRGRNYDDILRRIQIGSNALSHCSQIMFDKAAREIQLRCKKI